MTIEGLKTAFEAAVAAASVPSGTTLTAVWDWPWKLNENNRDYPCALFKPRLSSISDYNRHHETYNVELWLFALLQSSVSDETINKHKDLKDWGFDILDSFVDRSSVWFPPSNKGVEITYYDEENNDKLPAVKLTFQITVKDCRND